MTCVSAARASHSVLVQKFPEPAQARLGVAATKLPFSLLAWGCWRAAVRCLCRRTIDTARDARGDASRCRGQAVLGQQGGVEDSRRRARAVWGFD